MAQAELPDVVVRRAEQAALVQRIYPHLVHQDIANGPTNTVKQRASRPNAG